MPDDEEEALHLHRVIDGPQRGDTLYVPVQESLLHPVPLRFTGQESVTPWGLVDLMRELVALSEGKGVPLAACAKRYATASLPDKAQGWRAHPHLGLVAKR